MNNVWQVVKTILLRLRFVFVFIAVAVIVGSWSWIMNVVDRVTRPKPTAAAESEFEWFCPMHPTVVRSDAKEKCPICGMPLSKRKRGEKTELPNSVLSRLQLGPDRIRQAGLATDEITYRTLVREIRTVGFIEYDERRYAHISARVAGRADELFVNFTGVRVKKGDPVWRLYSPELITTQEEYLIALKALEEIMRASPGESEAIARAKRLADSSVERLRLWGLTDRQIEELQSTRKVPTHFIITSQVSGLVIKKDIHAGHYVQVGEDAYTLVDDASLWMMAEIFERDLGLVKEGATVEITSESYPGEAFSGRVSFIQPEVRPDTRTVRARVEVPNRDLKLKAGMYVTAVLRVPLGRRGKFDYVC